MFQCWSHGRLPVHHAMMPTAYEIAVAIVAACRETGAQPEAVVLGAEREHGGFPIRDAIFRARAYAGRAIDRVFNRPTIAIARPDISRLIGVNKPSWSAFFPSIDGRQLSWWDEDAFKRVVDAVMDCEPPEEQIKTGGAETVQSSPQTIEKPPETVQRPAAPKTAPVLRVPDPAKPKTPIGTLDRAGFRPVPDTVKRVLEDDKRSGSYVPVGRPLFKKDDDFLRRAVENTQKLTPPPED